MGALPKETNRPCSVALREVRDAILPRLRRAAYAHQLPNRGRFLEG